MAKVLTIIATVLLPLNRGEYHPHAFVRIHGVSPVTTTTKTVPPIVAHTTGSSIVTNTSTLLCTAPAKATSMVTGSSVVKATTVTSTSSRAASITQFTGTKMATSTQTVTTAAAAA